MPPSISLAIIDSERESRYAVEESLRPFSDRVRIVGSVGDFNEGVRLVQNENPTVVILEVRDLEEGIDQVRTLLSRSPQLSVFVTSSQKNSDWILGLMRAGACEYLLRPVERNVLLESLQKAWRLWESRKDQAVTRGKIISVYNPVGGMGTTTIAVNLAAAFAAKDEKVALVDLNLFSGDVATFLDVNPKYCLSSVTSNITRLDASFLMSVMTRHSCGMYVLSEPLEVEDTMNITAEQIERVLDFLRGVFSYIVIDCGGQLFGHNLATFKKSDHVLFTTVLTLPSLKNAKRYLAAMQKLGLEAGKVKLVVNRYLPKADIRVNDAEKVLDHKVFITVPNEYGEIIESINKGTPVVKLNPRSSVSSAITSLTGLLQ